MDILVIVNSYNDLGMSLKQIGEIYGKSKSTVQRLISKEGYVLNKITHKYEKDFTNEEFQNEQELIDNSEVVAFRLKDGTNNFKQHEEKFVNRTYSIPEQFDRALKVKSAIEGITVSDILRSILNSNIEQKYFDMVKGV